VDADSAVLLLLLLLHDMMLFVAFADVLLPRLTNKDIDNSAPAGRIILHLYYQY
jgi:hypothetical protein